MTEANVGRDYDRWLSGRSPSSRVYSFYASLPGMVLVNTAAFRLHTELQIKPEHRVLDIGCGRASLLQVLAARVPFQRPPVGLDLSGEMLRRARRDLSGAAYDIDLVQGAATKLPFADNQFDVATCAYVLKHLADTDLLRFFTDLKRILTPGGIAVLWEFTPSKGARRNKLNEWLLRRGVEECHLRDYDQLAAFATAGGFEWVGNASLRPFLWPPFPRISLIVGKAPPEYLHHDDE